MSDSGKTRKSLRSAEIIAVNDRLREVIEKVGDGCRYKDGHSDASVADEFDVTVHNIAGLRKQVYGNFVTRTAPSDSAVANLTAEVAALRTELEVIKRYVGWKPSWSKAYGEDLPLLHPGEL